MENDAKPMDALLTTDEAARFLSLSPRTLEHWREVGGGPSFLKVGRAVRYERRAMHEYLVGRSCQNTAEARVASQSLVSTTSKESVVGIKVLMRQRAMR